MLLTIDVGNTHTVLGLFDGEEVVEHWRISTDAARAPPTRSPCCCRGCWASSPLLGERRRHRRHRDLLHRAVGAARDARDVAAATTATCPR